MAPSPKEVTTVPAKVDPDACVACGACVEVCPADAIAIEDVAVIDEDACLECGACVNECPQSAISL